MKHPWIICIIVTLLTLSAYPSFAQEEAPQAGLLVTPTRVVLEGKYRSATVSLVNNGNKTGHYRLTLINKRMDENGKISKADTPQAGELFADEMLRISPRSVTLEPGEHQNVRILARKPKDLPDGEYRTHLNVMLLPDDELSEREKQAKERQNTGNSLVINIKANFGITIPVIVRQGTLLSTASVDSLSIGHNASGKPTAHFAIHREGTKSVYGDLRLVYKNSNGKEYIIKDLGGVAVYTPNSKRVFDLELDVPQGVTLKGGTVTVLYRAKEDDGGDTLAQAEVGV